MQRVTAVVVSVKLWRMTTPQLASDLWGFKFHYQIKIARVFSSSRVTALKMASIRNIIVFHKLTKQSSIARYTR